MTPLHKNEEDAIRRALELLRQGFEQSDEHGEAGRYPEALGSLAGAVRQAMIVLEVQSEIA